MRFTFDRKASSACVHKTELYVLLFRSTAWSVKCHFIWDYKFRVSWLILTLFIHGNRKECSTIYLVVLHHVIYVTSNVIVIIPGVFAVNHNFVSRNVKKWYYKTTNVKQNFLVEGGKSGTLVKHFNRWGICGECCPEEVLSLIRRRRRHVH